MDNINVIRVGFFAPQTVLNDTDMNAEDPIGRISGIYTCLAFVNPDDKGIGIIKALGQELSSLKSVMEWRLSVAIPLKPAAAQRFKSANAIAARIFCDGELSAGKSYSIVDSRSDAPTYHPTIFLIGDEGSVRQRFNLNEQEFNLTGFRDLIARVI
jgi:hypothetical protein